MSVTSWELSSNVNGKSIAAMTLSTDALITDVPEEKKAATPAMPPEY